MLSISHYIRTLLFEYDYVNLPGLGAFITNYSPSTSNEFSGSFMPPQKRVSFNEALKQDDGVLVLNISKKENISFNEASIFVKSYIEFAKSNLEANNLFTIEKVGSFSLNKDKKIVFEPEKSINFYGDSFGLDLVYPRKSNVYFTNEMDNNFNFKPAKKSSSSKYLKIFSANLPFILFGALLTFVVLKNDSTKQLSSMNPFAAISNLFESNNSPKIKINNSIKRFNVVTPYFKNIEDANLVKMALNEDGFKNAQVFKNKEVIFVKVDVFYNENEALNFKETLFKTYKQEFQILEN